ncbi:MAG: prolipoprotein diacylglyceryl transferase [Saccharofermentanales bacterium]|jgi:phosphatidylglycerol:prolipoprotein diacylglycerol transferase
MLPDTTYFVNFPGLGIENLEINRIAFQIGSISIYWYGLLIASAILLCLYLSLRHSRFHGLNPDNVLDIYIAIIPAMIIFARLYYVAFQWPMYRDNLLLILDTRTGGLAFYGGVIGGVLAAWLVARFKKIPFSRVADFLIVYVPLGQAIGRWGNFFNQEAFGTNTTLPWGMISNETTRYLNMLNDASLDPKLPVHPTFLYEFLANMALFIILLVIRRRSKRPYTTLFSYLIGYGITRFFVESIRTDALYVPGTSIRVSMVLSAVMVLGGLAGLLLIRSHVNKHPLPEPVDDTDKLDFNITGQPETDFFREQSEDETAATETEDDAETENDAKTETMAEAEAKKADDSSES